MTEKHLRLEYRLDSRGNQRGHWRKLARFKAEDRTVGDLLCYGWLNGHGPMQYPARITLTRIAPRMLDDDNLRTAFKGIRDGIADRLKLPNDRDPRVQWEYAQQKGRPKYYAVQMTVC